MKRILTIVAVLMLAGAGSASAETVWKWTGKDGKPAFGKQPPPGVKAEQVEVLKANAGNLGDADRTGSSGEAGGGARASGAVLGPGNPLAQSAMEPVEIGGKLIESGSVRLRARAEGRDLDPGRAACPPELPICRKKGDAAPSGRPTPPRALQGTQGP